MPNDPDELKSPPLSYKQMVHKIISDAGYAKEIADLIRAARNGDKKATNELNKRFRPREDEIDDLHIEKEAWECKSNPVIFKTNPTGFFLIDFARMC